MSVILLSLNSEIPAWLTDSEEFSSFLKPFREIYEDYIKAYKHHQTRERAIQQVESEWRRQQSDSARSASAPMVVRLLNLRYTFNRPLLSQCLCFPFSNRLWTN
jgi:uncharacterized membrane protein (DUF106 family)